MLPNLGRLQIHKPARRMIRTARHVQHVPRLQQDVIPLIEVAAGKVRAGVPC